MPQPDCEKERARVGRAPGGCLVLFAGSGAEPAVLLRALRARGLQTRVVRDEPGVMEALAGGSEGRRVLVVVGPEQWGRLDELVHAVRTYHPGVYCWQYRAEAGVAGRLSAIDSANGDENDAAQAPAGRLYRRHRVIDELLVQVPGEPLSAREIVTQQELTMLLGPVPGEAS